MILRDNILEQYRRDDPVIDCIARGEARYIPLWYPLRYKGVPLIHLALLYKRMDSFLFFVEKSGHPLFQTYKKLSTLSVACAANMLEAVNYILDHGGSDRGSQHYLNSCIKPINFALWHDNLLMVQTLLKKGEIKKEDFTISCIRYDAVKVFRYYIFRDYCVSIHLNTAIAFGAWNIFLLYKDVIQNNVHFEHLEEAYRSGRSEMFRFLIEKANYSDLCSELDERLKQPPKNSIFNRIMSLLPPSVLQQHGKKWLNVLVNTMKNTHDRSSRDYIRFVFETIYRRSSCLLDGDGESLPKILVDIMRFVDHERFYYFKQIMTKKYEKQILFDTNIMDHIHEYII